MAQPLDYDSYQEVGNKGSKGSKESKGSSTGLLANRPLPSVGSAHYKSPVDCPSCSSHIRPANKEDIYKIDHRVSPVDAQTPISLVLKPGVDAKDIGHLDAVAYDETVESDYFLSDLDHDIASSKETAEKEKKKPVAKMDFTTQLYVGSLTVVGLYVIFRLLYKMK